MNEEERRGPISNLYKEKTTATHKRDKNTHTTHHSHEATSSSCLPTRSSKMETATKASTKRPRDKRQEETKRPRALTSKRQREAIERLVWQRRREQQSKQAKRKQAETTLEEGEARGEQESERGCGLLASRSAGGSFGACSCDLSICPCSASRRIK